jgi:SAM-dependent methyltransferase
MRSWKQIKRGLERRLLPTWYGLGNRVTCCYCGWTGSRFLPAGASRAPNRLCPRCGSLERYRSLWLYLQQQGVLQGNTRIKLLDIAPRPCFRNFCRQQTHLTYVGSDLDSPEAMVHSDLTQMGMADKSWDVIVCFHVLEHIPEDYAALAEIRRLLKPTGFALLMVPIKGAKTFEDPTVPLEAYERVYGQVDHVRICGLDYEERMVKSGLTVQRIDLFQHFPPATVSRYALYGDDQYLFHVTP